MLLEQVAPHSWSDPGGHSPRGDTVGASFARFLMAVAYLPLADRVALVGMKVG